MRTGLGELYRVGEAPRGLAAPENWKDRWSRVVSALQTSAWALPSLFFTTVENKPWPFSLRFCSRMNSEKERDH